MSLMRKTFPTKHSLENGEPPLPVIFQRCLSYSSVAPNGSTTCFCNFRGVESFVSYETSSHQWIFNVLVNCNPANEGYLSRYIHFTLSVVADCPMNHLGESITLIMRSQQTCCCPRFSISLFPLNLGVASTWSTWSDPAAGYTSLREEATTPQLGPIGSILKELF